MTKIYNTAQHDKKYKTDIVDLHYFAFGESSS